MSVTDDLFNSNIINLIFEKFEKLSLNEQSEFLSKTNNDYLAMLIFVKSAKQNNFEDFLIDVDDEYRKLHIPKDFIEFIALNNKKKLVFKEEQIENGFFVSDIMVRKNVPMELFASKICDIFNDNRLWGNPEDQMPNRKINLSVIEQHIREANLMCSLETNNSQRGKKKI